jgi:preprotein translocase subunit SecE
MTNSSKIIAVVSAADKIKFTFSTILAVSALIALYIFGGQGLWVRVGVFAFLMGVAIFIFLASENGKRLIAYARDSEREVRKMVWPSPGEALQVTGYVFAFVFIMALFLWLTDKTFEWLFYDVVLGWRR